MSSLWTDIMIDIETLGSNAQAPIIQIGACVFNLRSGEIGMPLSVLVKPNFSYQRPDESTVAWWMQQNDAARLHVALCISEGSPADEALSVLETYYSKAGLPPNVWAMPPSFDIVILEHTAAHFGRKMPWRFDACRDLRTLEYMADCAKKDRVLAVVAHDAGADAVAQAATAIKYYRKIDEVI